MIAGINESANNRDGSGYLVDETAHSADSVTVIFSKESARVFLLIDSKLKMLPLIYVLKQL